MHQAVRTGAVFSRGSWGLNIDLEPIAMRPITVVYRQFLSSESGQDLVEYALMAGLVAVAAGSVIPPMGASIATIFSKAMSVLERFS
jgi:pilus assembly protein Flp/PilA